MRGTLVAMVMLLTLTGCGGEEASPVTQPTEETVGDALGVDTSLTADEQTELLERLSSIDPALGTEDYLSEARNTCLDLQQDSPLIARNTRLRFSDSEAGEVSDAQVDAIITAVRETFCSP